jgi:putative RNA 2'-phosphotransferase
VHLSPDEPTAIKVGRRHGRPVVLAVQAGRMHEDGHEFFLSRNGVWLTKRVPREYIVLEESG